MRMAQHKATPETNWGKHNSLCANNCSEYGMNSIYASLVPLSCPSLKSSLRSRHSYRSQPCSTQANDFGSEVIPGAKDLGMHVQAYLYDGYWEDIGTIEAFYQANLALTKNPKPDYRSALPHIHVTAGQQQQWGQNPTAGVQNPVCAGSFAYLSCGSTCPT